MRKIGEHGNINLAVASDVSGTLTIRVEDIHPRALLDLVVEMAGLASRTQDGVIRVLTREGYEDTYGTPYADVRERRLFTLEDAAAPQVAPVAAAFKSATGSVFEDPRGNALIGFDLPERLDAMQALIDSLDHPLETRALRAQGPDVEHLAERLSSELGSAAAVEADPAARRILVTGTAPAVARASRLLEILDQEVELKTRVLPLAYARPESICKLVRPLLTPTVGDVHADRTGRIFLRDLPVRVDLVAARVHDLDVPPQQVLLECSMLRITMDTTTQTGIEWTLLSDRLGGATIEADFPLLVDVGARFTTHSESIRLVAEALETYGKTDLLSSPRIMVADGQSAYIHVGSQVPYVTTDSREGPNGVIDRFEKVTIVNTGVVLEVTARIHGDSTVTLALRQELSAVTDSLEGIPVVDEIETRTPVHIRDRSTVIVGGLESTGWESVEHGVPILCRLPLLKYLFSSTSQRVVRRHLLVMITARVMPQAHDRDGHSG